jgi:hypothetical protein
MSELDNQKIGQKLFLYQSSPLHRNLKLPWLERSINKDAYLTCPQEQEASTEIKLDSKIYTGVVKMRGSRLT